MASSKSAEGGSAQAWGQGSSARADVDKLIAYCSSTEFSDCFDEFLREKSALFAEHAQRGGEYTLEQTAAHKEYLELFEEQLKQYREDTGFTSRQIYEAMAEVQREYPNSFTAHCVQICLCTLEFEEFANLCIDFASKKK